MPKSEVVVKNFVSEIFLGLIQHKQFGERDEII